MKKSLLPLLLLASAGAAHAQTATFEALPLPGADTFYVNHSAANEDVGFTDSSFYFPTVFGEYGGMWYQASGFVYSNMRDTVTPGFTNEYSARAGAGYLASEKYAVSYYSPFAENYFLVAETGGRKLSGVAITNNTYAYLSMRDGDFVAKQFGGESGDDPDFLKVIFRGYLSGAPVGDSVAFYLADFRFEDNSLDYIVKDWQWVDLSALGKVDSVVYDMESSDVGEFGINTPTYFCIDDLTMAPVTIHVAGVAAPRVLAYPNPARQLVTLETTTAGSYRITDITGRTQAAGLLQSGKNNVSLAHLPAGTYLIHLRQEASVQTIKISVEQ